MVQETDCIFCKIAKKEAEAMIVYENDINMVFLAAEAIADGHLLVITKQHQVTVMDLGEKELGDIMKTTKIVSQLLIDKLGADGVNLLNASGKIAQQSIFHFHVVPRFENDGKDLWFGKVNDSFDGRDQNIFDKLMN